MISAVTEKIAEPAAVLTRWLGRFLPGRTRPTPKEKNALESKYDEYSGRAHRVAYFIVIGLAVEIIGVFVLGKPFWDGFFTISSSALIILGVWRELYWDKKAREAGDGIVADAKARAAEALQKAELERHARLKLEAKLSPRVLIARSQQTIAEKLLPMQGQRVMLCEGSADRESRLFARHLGAALTGAGWQIEYPPAPFSPLWPGGVLLAHGPGIQSTGAANALAAALRAEKVFVGVIPFPSVDENWTSLYVIVGEKPDDDEIEAINNAKPRAGG